MVCDPIIKDSINKYVVYAIRGTDNDGSFEIYRRYSDFHNLRKTMVKRWPGCYVPPIPEKKAVVKHDFYILVFLFFYLFMFFIQ
jgi:sorting nexin-1/2